MVSILEKHTITHTHPHPHLGGLSVLFSSPMKPAPRKATDKWSHVNVLSLSILSFILVTSLTHFPTL